VVSFRKGIPKQVAKLLNTKAKSQRKLRKTELEGEFAQREPVSPTRHVPILWRDRKYGRQGHSDGLGINAL
jgi:hypothetical protein